MMCCNTVYYGKKKSHLLLIQIHSIAKHVGISFKPEFHRYTHFYFFEILPQKKTWLNFQQLPAAGLAKILDSDKSESEKKLSPGLKQKGSSKKAQKE